MGLGEGRYFIGEAEAVSLLDRARILVKRLGGELSARLLNI
jgi:hypothetical protein